VRKINLFVEDRGHAVFLQALVQRLADHYRIPVFIRLGSARGGYGKMVSKLKEYISDLQLDQEDLPDLLIVATDGNCKGYMGRKQEIDSAVKGFNRRVIYAIPDPHIERWLLLDSAAFKKVLGRGCSAPIQKCERALYKRLLLEAVRKAGVNPPLGGIEYAEDLVHAMNLEYLERIEDSLGKLLKALREIFREWEQSEQSMP
jgi:Domain of unknown function (DUF4276)